MQQVDALQPTYIHWGRSLRDLMEAYKWVKGMTEGDIDKILTL